MKETEAAARKLRVQLQLLGVGGANDFDGAFSDMSKERADALLVFPSPMLYLEYKRIVDLVTKIRLPAVYPWREAVDAGGLMSYGASIPDMLRHAAFLVGRIFNGVKPADPVLFAAVHKSGIGTKRGCRVVPVTAASKGTADALCTGSVTSARDPKRVSRSPTGICRKPPRVTSEWCPLPLNSCPY